MADTNEIEKVVAAVTVRASADQIAEALSMVKAAKERIGELEKDLKARLYDFVEEHGPIQIGDIRWYNGIKKEAECQDVPGVIEALLGAVGGDFGAFCQLLCSQPLKPGACREPLGEAWDRFFIVKEKPEVRPGKPDGKSLLSINTRFLR